MGGSRAVRRAAALAAGSVLLVLAALVLTRFFPRSAAILRGRSGGRSYTVRDRQEELGPAARRRLTPSFEAAGITYPPARVALVVIKSEKVLQVYAAGPGTPFASVRTYPILAASGGPGPKLREGDRQVPEGIYPIESLNPNSRHHLALRIGYPGKFDREMARRDGRAESSLGGDIMIHGGRSSIGCLAVGDEAAEDLFILAADVGIDGLVAVLAPVDFREDARPPEPARGPVWVGELYGRIRAELDRYPPPDGR